MFIFRKLFRCFTLSSEPPCLTCAILFLHRTGEEWSKKTVANWAISDQDIMDIKREDMAACQEPFALASG